MRPLQAYGELRRLEQAVITTRDAAALWQTGEGTARRRLRSLQEAGLVLGLRRGLWALDPAVDPFAVAPYLTAPLPAYVSLFSALAVHGLIEQIPRQVSLASLDRARRIETALGRFEVHHLAPEVFGGFVAWKGGGFVASPEKALFDLVYIRAASGRRAFVPELSLPPGFDREGLSAWSERIRGKRLRTLVSERLRELLRDASQQRGD